MTLTSRLRDRIAGSPTYVCEGCGKPYDRDRRNCSACGFDVVPRRDT